MRSLRIGLLVIALAASAGCSSKFKTYNGPEVTQIVVSKNARQMYLLHHDKVLKAFDVQLGFTAEGHKQFEGDGKTPEGDYVIDRRNPNSRFHLSLGISYPNAEDIAFAEAAGKSPGGDIFIHGRPNGKVVGLGPDWTAGCISVRNRHIEQVYAMVRDGTPIRINP